MVYFEKFATLSHARKRQNFLKKQKNKNFYNRLITDFDTSQLVIPSPTFGACFSAACEIEKLFINDVINNGTTAFCISRTNNPNF